MGFDWSKYDLEGAMRQRYIDIDDRTEQARAFVTSAPVTEQEFQDTYDISWIYHENGLEGVVLTYPEIRSAVDNKIISDVSLLPTYNEIKNQKWCIDSVREKALSRRAQITVPYLEEIHGRLLGDPTQATVYRKDIPIHRTYFHSILPPNEIAAGLDSVLEYMKQRHEDVHPVEFAADAHHQFMRVFPFSKCSGTIGRLLLNFILIRNGYVPVVIHATDRQTYYEALRGSERDFRLFLADAMENALGNALRFFDNAREERMPRRAAQ